VPVGTSAFVSSVFTYSLFNLLCISDHAVVVVDDHIALPLLAGLNPLLGPLSRPTAERFVALSDAYARPLRLAAFRAAHTLGFPRAALAEGTYAWVSGPTYETRGEARLLAGAGASVVGMSTVPEVVAARDEGLRVLVLSLVTNVVVGIESGSGRRVSVREEIDDEVRPSCWLCCVGEKTMVSVFFFGFCFPVLVFLEYLARGKDFGTPADSDGVACGGLAGWEGQGGGHAEACRADHHFAIWLVVVIIEYT